MTLKQALQSFAIVATLAAAPQLAHATVYSGSASFTDTTNNNTLKVNATPNPASFTSTDINVGQSFYDAGLMTIITSGDFSSIFAPLGATQSDNIALTFSFTAPSAASGVVDQSGKVTQTEFVIAAFDNASLTFTGDTHVDQNGRFARQTVTFADGAQAYLDVYDTAISGTTTARAAQIDIRLTNLANPTNVPEPASMALLGAGLVGAGMVRRKKRAA